MPKQYYTAKELEERYGIKLDDLKDLQNTQPHAPVAPPVIEQHTTAPSYGLPPVSAEPEQPLIPIWLSCLIWLILMSAVGGMIFMFSYCNGWCPR